MSVTESTRPAEIDADLPSARSRWSRRAKLLTFGAVLVALLAAIYLYLASYQPVMALPNNDSGVWRLVRLDSDVYALQAGFPGEAKFYSPGPGVSFVVGQTFANNGPFAVKVTKVSSSFWLVPNHEVTYKVVDQRAVFRTGGQFVPLKSLTVKARDLQSPMLGVRFTIPKCADKARNYPTGLSIRTAEMKVTYKFLWFTHTVKIPTLSPAIIVNPNDCGTPGN
jgi:hypothetical protein